MLKRFLKPLRALFRRSEAERELDEELAYHLERQIELNVADGMRPDEARLAALRSFDGLEQAKEECRDARRVRLVEETWLDVRYGLRSLGRSPGLTATIAVSLAIGIGANTAVFGLLDAVLLRALPVAHPEQLVFVNNVGRLGGSGAPPYPCFERFRDHSRTLTGLAAFSPDEMKVTVDNGVERVRGQYVSGSYFSVLGVSTVIGRPLSAEDDSVLGTGGPDGPVAVISYAYWRQRFGQSPDVLGRRILVGKTAVTIVGVTPPAFHGLRPGFDVHISVPMMLADRDMLTNDSTWWFDAVGRLAPGTSVDEARVELDGIFATFMDEISLLNETRDAYFARIELAPAAHGLDHLRRQFSTPLLMLMGAVGVVLLVACANIATLLLARATARRKEVAVRLALGASRVRVVRQLLTESLLLSVFGGALGLLASVWCNRLLERFFASGRSATTLDLSLDPRILLFTAALSLLTCLLFGLAPAARAVRVEPNTDLRGGADSAGAHGARLRGGRLLVVVQVAGCFVLLVVAGLLARSLQNLRAMDAGFRPDGVLTMRVDAGALGDAKPRIDELWNGILERVAGLGAVRSASLSTLSPLSGKERGVAIDVAGYAPVAELDRVVKLNTVSADYFATMGVEVLRGRTFSARDDESAPRVTVLNETAARFYFGDEDPIGQHIRRGVARREPSADDLVEIVGVVRDSRHNSLRDATPRLVYVPLGQAWDGSTALTLGVRTDGDPRGLASAVRGAVLSSAPDVEITDLVTLGEQVDRSLLEERLVSALSSLFGALALGLASTGLYGLLSYEVSRRRREIGIRVALGAHPSSVRRLVLKEGVLLTAVGVAVGALVALAVTRFLASLLYTVSATDPAIVVVCTLLLGVISVAASYLPARRATKVDPLIAIRSE